MLMAWAFVGRIHGWSAVGNYVGVMRWMERVVPLQPTTTRMRMWWGLSEVTCGENVLLLIG